MKIFVTSLFIPFLVIILALAVCASEGRLEPRGPRRLPHWKTFEDVWADCDEKMQITVDGSGNTEQEINLEWTGRGCVGEGRASGNLVEGAIKNATLYRSDDRDDLLIGGMLSDSSGQESGIIMIINSSDGDDRRRSLLGVSRTWCDIIMGVTLKMDGDNLSIETDSLSVQKFKFLCKNNNLLWITEAKEDVGKCRGGDTEAENRGEGPPMGEPQGRTACRGATGERGEEGVGRNE
jgi:hypothetical protein